MLQEPHLDRILVVQLTVCGNKVVLKLCLKRDRRHQRDWMVSILDLVVFVQFPSGSRFVPAMTESLSTLELRDYLIH